MRSDTELISIIKNSLMCSSYQKVFVSQIRNVSAIQAETLSAAKRAEMADVEQMKKIVPLVTCEITFGQYVCELMFGADVPNLNLGSKLILSNNQSRATLWFFCHMSHCRTPAFDHHINHGFIVLLLVLNILVVLI